MQAARSAGRAEIKLRHLRRGAAFAALGLVAWLAFEHDAAAEAKIGVEARGEFMRRFNVTPYGGVGLEGNFGWSFDPYPIMVIPEVAVEGAVYPGEYFG